MAASLTNKERKVLNLLMNAEKSMTASEIVANDSGLNNNTTQSVLRALLRRDFIEVAEIVYSGKVLCRSYKPTAKAKAAAFQEFASRFHSLRKDMPVPKIFADLIDSEEDKQAIIEELEAMIAEKRASLGKEDV